MATMTRFAVAMRRDRKGRPTSFEISCWRFEQTLNLQGTIISAHKQQKETRF